MHKSAKYACILSCIFCMEYAFMRRYAYSYKYACLHIWRTLENCHVEKLIYKYYEAHRGRVGRVL